MVSDGRSGTPECTVQQRKCSETTQQNQSSSLDPAAKMEIKDKKGKAVLNFVIIHNKLQYCTIPIPSFKSTQISAKIVTALQTKRALCKRR